MKHTLRRTENVTEARALHMLTFPHDEWEGDPNVYWIARDERASPVGFCSARKLKGENGVFLSRAGVLPAAHGAGLQRRMIDVRVRWARSIGAEYAITYTTYWNHASIANLLRCGFRFFKPAYAFAGKEVHYFKRDL